MRVSVIIPLKRDNPYLRETLDCLSQIDYPDYEVIVLPDEHCSLGDDVRVVPTGPVGPAAKRDLAIAHSTGDLLAFLDDDTYPERDWLKNAAVYFDDECVGAIGGPATTPPTDGFFQRASGYVYQSLLGGGNYAYRYIPQKAREVDDYPTCNLLVRRSVMEQLGGFDTNFWPGEDTILCLGITRKLGLRIIYAPDVLVYHHRRPLFRSHLSQVRNYATHRGYFCKRFPETSLRISYFLPTFLTVGMLAGAILSVFLPALAPLYLFGLCLYALAALLSAAIACRSWAYLAPVALGIVATHLTYGIWFVKGLVSPRLSEEA